MIFGTLGPNGLSVIERCPYYRGVRKERLDCTTKRLQVGGGYAVLINKKNYLN